MEDTRIDQIQTRIQRLEQLVTLEKEKLQNVRQVQRRKHELEKISAQHAKDSKSSPAKPPQTEAVTKPSRFEVILNSRSQVVGYRQNLGSQTVFLDAKGKVVAWENGNKTYDRRGLFAGYGRQGLRLIGQSSKVGNI
jgi:hypothetical protein